MLQPFDQVMADRGFKIKNRPNSEAVLVAYTIISCKGCTNVSQRCKKTSDLANDKFT